MKYGDVFTSDRATLVYLSIANFDRDTHWVLVVDYKSGPYRINYLGREIEPGMVVEAAKSVLRLMASVP